MLRSAEKYCRAHELFHRGDGVVVACSGGADSMALAQWLWEHREVWGLRLCVAHFEHGIRGEDSLKDADFVKKWCEERDLMFRVGSSKVPLVAEQRGISLETAARELRYGFLEQVRQELGCTAIATAHHADDQAETVLMRFLRGSGIDGLAAMLPRSGHLIRPLLTVRKRVLEEFCRARGIAYRHDATNDLPGCTRNRLRLELIPLLEREYNPGIVETSCRLAELAAEQRDYIRSVTAGLFPLAVRKEGGPALSQEVFRGQPVALQRSLLRMFLEERGMGCRDLGFVHFDGLRALAVHGGTGSSMELPGGWLAVLSYGWLRVEKRMEGETVGILPEYTIPVPGRISLREYGVRIEAWILKESPERMEQDEYCCELDALSETLVVRARRKGDAIRLSMGRKSLKKLFIDSRIPKRERANYPVVVSGDEVLWVPWLRRSVLHAATSGTGRILYLKIAKEEGREHDEG